MEGNFQLKGIAYPLVLCIILDFKDRVIECDPQSLLQK